MKKNSFSFFLIFIFSQTVCPKVLADDGGFSLGATRVIYLSSKSNAVISVYNTSRNTPLLIQSWVSNENNEAKAPFVITPPLYRQDNGNNVLRIIHTGGPLPADRESLFFINVKAIAASPAPFRVDTTTDNIVGSKINIAFVNQIKLFYRPQALQSTAASAYQELTFLKRNNQLIVKNPTPFYITLKLLNLGNNNLLIKNDKKSILAPFSQGIFLINFPTTSHQVTYRAINDFGGMTPMVNKNL